MNIVNARFPESPHQSLLVVLGKLARARIGSNINELLDPERLEQTQEFLKFPRRVPDSKDPHSSIVVFLASCCRGGFCDQFHSRLIGAMSFLG